MDDRRRWTGAAALAFALVGFELAFLGYVVGTYTTSLESLRDGLTRADFAVFSLRDAALAMGACAIAGALVGAAAWYLVVERVDRWSTRRRGAVAGGLTGWLALPVAMVPLFAASSDLGMAAVVAVAALWGLIVAAGFVGWATVPVCALVGYALGRRRAGETPLLPVVRERIG